LLGDLTAVTGSSKLIAMVLKLNQWMRSKSKWLRYTFRGFMHKQQILLLFARSTKASAEQVGDYLLHLLAGITRRRRTNDCCRNYELGFQQT
jgi:hypothetical protein